jgi:hypothetical protein
MSHASNISGISSFYASHQADKTSCDGCRCTGSVHSACTGCIDQRNSLRDRHADFLNIPDSVVFGDSSLWVSYQNNADSTGASGSSTVVRYSSSGVVVSTWTIAGNVDGLRIDPTGQVWALQNQDANSALTVINPVTNATQRVHVWQYLHRKRELAPPRLR